MSDILDEIKESLKEKQKNKIIGWLTISLFVCGIIFITYLGLYSWNESKNNEIIQSDGVLLTQAANNINYSKLKTQTPDEKKGLDMRNKIQIEKLEKLAINHSSAYSALANIYLASIALMEGNHSKAIYYYQRIAKEDSYHETLREYANLVEINAKLQYTNGIYDSIIKQLDEYFAPYLKDDKIIEHKLAHQKLFSSAMALTGIAVNDLNGNVKNSMKYLQALQQHDSLSENFNFIVDMLSQYLEQKQVNQKQ